MIAIIFSLELELLENCYYNRVAESVYYRMKLATEHSCKCSLLIENVGREMMFRFHLKSSQACDLLKTWLYSIE